MKILYLSLFLLVMNAASFSQSFDWHLDGYTTGSGGGTYSNIDGSGIDLQIIGLYNDEIRGEKGVVTGINNHASDTIVHQYQFIFSEKVDVRFSVYDINMKSGQLAFVDYVAFSGNPIFSNVWGVKIINDSLVVPNNSGNLVVEYYNVDRITITHGEGIALNPGFIEFSPIEFIKSSGPREKISFTDIHFDTGKYKIRDKESQSLDSLINFLIENPKANVELRGYTDDVGNEQENYNLSVDRVASVLDYLEGNGILRSRIKVMSYGEMRPVDNNETAEGRKQNRRVEIKVIEIR